MIDNSISASSMPRLPVSWREFSELLRIRTSEVTRDLKDQEVAAVEPGRLDIRSDESSNQQDQHRFSSRNLRTEEPRVNPNYEGEPTPNYSPPVDGNSSTDYPNGFDAYA